MKYTVVTGVAHGGKTYPFKNKYIKRKRLTNFIALIECNSPDHTTCWRIQTKLMKNFNNIMSSYTTDVIIQGKHYCICATGLITSNNNNAIKRAINKTKWRNNKVKYTKLLASD